MKFETRFDIIFLLISFLHLVHGKSYTFSKNDCPSSPSDQTPKVLIESSSGFNSRRPSVFNSTDFVDDAGFSRGYFDCRHSTPVQWILDIHPSRDAFQFTRSFSQKVSNSSFSAYVEFLYKSGDQGDLKRPILFICASVCGGHTFLEITPGQYSALIQPTSKPTTATFTSLAKVLLNPQPPPNKDDSSSSCDMMLHVKVTHDSEGCHHLFYAWNSAWNEGILVEKNLSVLPTQTGMDQGIYFRNIFRTVMSGQRGRGHNCAKHLNETDLCTNCVEVILPSGEEGQSQHLNSVAFFARSNTLVKMAFKGIFSITRPQRFYFDWELENSYTALLDLVDFQAPPVLYAGHEIELNCSVSSIYFAYGTLIYGSRDIDVTNNISHSAPFSGNLGETETWFRDGRRIVSKGIVFHTGNQTETLTCSAPLWDWSKRVEKTVQVFVDFRAPAEIEGGSSEPEVRIVETSQENVTLTCSAVGKPRPILQWSFPFSAQDVNASDWIEILSKEPPLDDDNSVGISSTILIAKIHSQVLGTYLCSAFNIFGNASKSFTLQVPEVGLSLTTKVSLSSSLGLLILVGLVTVGIIYRKIILQRREYATKTAEAIREFKEGVKRAQLEKEKMSVFFSSTTTKKMARDKLGDLVEEEEEISICPHQSILELPYDSRYEVDLIKWIIDESILGSGTFGIVRKGTVEVANKRQSVAVKVLKSTVEIEDFKSFLTELKIMAYIGKHPNIVSLVAACTQNIEQRDVMIGVEFCANGNLQEYLQEKRSMFQTGSLEARNSMALKTLNYSNLNNPVALTELDLFTWAYQIANGMEFLSNKNVLHGDLATRNVLLTMDKTAKISDFGLSRVLLEANKNYTKKSRVPLPWKWMALESLKSLQFSSASDVWAFGVTIFEIFSLGEIPYAGLSFGPEFILQLENGFRLAKPPLATEYVYNIMKHCWNPAVEHRTSFPQLKIAFSELLEVFTNPGGAPVPPMGRRRLNTPTSVFQSSPVAQPRRLANQPPQENWYSNRPIQIPNLYLNV